jgi:hypothetical protein
MLSRSPTLSGVRQNVRFDQADESLHSFPEQGMTVEALGML